MSVRSFSSVEIASGRTNRVFAKYCCGFLLVESGVNSNCNSFWARRCRLLGIATIPSESAERCWTSGGCAARIEWIREPWTAAVNWLSFGVREITGEFVVSSGGLCNS